MLHVSELALVALARTLDANRDNPDDVLRIAKVQGRMLLTLDQEQVGDQVISLDERHVLAVAPEASELLDGLTLDLDRDDSGVKFVFLEPGGASREVGG